MQAQGSNGGMIAQVCWVSPQRCLSSTLISKLEGHHNVPTCVSLGFVLWARWKWHPHYPVMLLLLVSPGPGLTPTCFSHTIYTYKVFQEGPALLFG